MADTVDLLHNMEDQIHKINSLHVVQFGNWTSTIKQRISWQRLQGLDITKKKVFKVSAGE